MSADFVARLLGMALFAVLGAYFGIYLAGLTNGQAELYTVSMALLGALFGLILTPYFTTRPVRFLRSTLARVSPQTLVAGLIGLIAGLIIAALLAFPISLLPPPFGDILPGRYKRHHRRSYQRHLPHWFPGWHLADTAFCAQRAAIYCRLSR